MQGKHHREIGKPKTDQFLAAKTPDIHPEYFVLTQRTGLFFYFSFALRLSSVINPGYGN